MLRKVFLSAAVVLPFSASSMADQKQQIKAINQNDQDKLTNIEDLRNQCEKWKAHSQVKDFKIELQCSGSITQWREKSSQLPLDKKGRMETKLYYVKQADPVSTPGDRVEFTQKTVGPQCMIYDRYRISAPNNKIHLNQCEDITKANIDKQCTESILNYCEEVAYNFKADKQSQQIAACHVEIDATINTCDRYTYTGDNNDSRRHNFSGESDSSEGSRQSDNHYVERADEND